MQLASGIVGFKKFIIHYDDRYLREFFWAYPNWPNSSVIMFLALLQPITIRGLKLTRRIFFIRVVVDSQDINS